MDARRTARIEKQIASLEAKRSDLLEVINSSVAATAEDRKREMVTVELQLTRLRVELAA